MKTTSRHQIIRSSIYTACFVFLFGTPVFAANPPDQEGQPENTKPIVIKKTEDIFDYQIEGRADPFMPFVSEKAPTKDPNEIVDENKNLTGMQLFEPGQLTLVALMSTKGQKFAMVQDFTGKGYVIVEGTKIGRRGVVADIVENKVIIEETAHTRSGKVLKNQIAMVLKKEGEE